MYNKSIVGFRREKRYRDVMVTGKEKVFDNIDEALKFVLLEEKEAFNSDVKRQFPLRIFLADSLVNPLTAFYNNASEERFIMTRLHSGRYSLKPNLCKRAFLFRGESEFHQHCIPNLYRDLSQVRYTAEMARGQEMMLLMLSHPLVQLLDMGVELDGRVYQFEMNLFGLTQHYYNKTPFLDLTSNPEVAAFFATTHYDYKTDTYSPVMDSDKPYGVLYYYKLDVGGDFVWTGLRTIGLQVFPRSERQSGFLYEMKKGEDFNLLPQLGAVFFKHNGTIAERISQSFHYGADLFPSDVLTNHWKHNNLDKMQISNRTVLLNKHFNPEMTKAEVEGELTALGFSIKDYVPSFTQAELDAYFDAVQNKGLWTNFCSMIHIPGDRNGKMMNELLNLPANPKYRWAFERDSSHVSDPSKGFLMSLYKDCLQ